MYRNKSKQILLFICVAVLASIGTAQAGCNDKRSPGMDWSGCKKTNKMLDDSNFSDSHFDNANLSRSSLDGVNFSGASLVKTDLTKVVSANRARFIRADLTKAVGYRANFEHAIVQDSNLTKSEFSRANFKNTELSGIDWSKSELGRIDFSGARLDQVSFEFTNLSRARFSSAHLTNVNLEGAYTYLTRFQGVDLRGTSNLRQFQLDIACGDDSTRLPDGLSQSENWPCTE